MKLDCSYVLYKQLRCSPLANDDFSITSPRIETNRIDCYWFSTSIRNLREFCVTRRYSNTYFILSPSGGTRY